MFEELSDKEKQLTLLICEEIKIKEIAQKMNVSKQTIYTYKKRLLKKIGAKTDIGIMIFAIKNNII